ncbi:hypothetical protein F4561_002180 [Lipingzhangella halophila]|uniref:Uncharacterized protein n=1 Tax=Lipingzhangella halophila TaxID=1783352 RepID=A0A7W7RG55_9ACTN|nr:hypothetical protein [Lipingzhangella halophila]
MRRSRPGGWRHPVAYKRPFTDLTPHDVPRDMAHHT